MRLLVRRLKLRVLPPPAHSPPLYYLTPLAFSRLLSSTCAVSPPQCPQPQALPPHTNPPSFTFSPDYLIHSCGLSSDQAVCAYEKIQYLKYPHKPDAVLRFLRQIGISNSHITRAVSRSARILCSSVDKNLRPNVAKLQEVGLSIHDISFILSRTPTIFQFNFAPKIDFWLGVLGSAQNFSVALRRCGTLLSMDVEKTILPNLCFLKDHCGLSASRIAQLIRSDPRLIQSNPETLKVKAQRAEELGFVRPSGMFVNALIMTNRLSQHTLDARVNNLAILGLSQKEVNLMISKNPMLLALSEELISIKMEFLLNEAGCDKNDIVLYPVILTYSLDKRLIPRNIVRKLLMSNGFQPTNYKFSSLVSATEKQFVEKYVLPNEHAIPGLHRAYVDACATKNMAIY